MNAKAKRIDNGEWVEGYFYERNNSFGNNKMYILYEKQTEYQIDLKTLTFPQLERLEQENAKLKEVLKDLCKAIDDINGIESFPNCTIIECIEDQYYNAKALTQEEGEEK